MIISKVASLCKAEKQLNIFYDNFRKEQWIGTEKALYPAYDLPDLGEDHIFSIFGFTEAQKHKTKVIEGTISENIELVDEHPTDNLLDKTYFNILLEKEYMPIYTQQGLMLIEDKLLNPIAKDRSGIELYERLSPKGELYIVVKRGFLLVGVIIPTRINKKQADAFIKLAQMSGIAMEYQQQIETKKLDSGIDQITLEISE